MQYITYFLFKLFIYPIAALPFTIIYKISDGLYFLLYYILKYRKGIVYDNLRRAFPKKSKLEIEVIAKQNFRNLADTLIESIKLFGISKKEFRRRMQLSDDELTNHYFAEGKPVIAISGHFGNWEYGAIMNEYIKHQLIILYKPLKNKMLNEEIVQSRSRFGLKIWSNRNTQALFVESFAKSPMYVFIGDQNPSNPRKAYWSTFLGRNTCFYTATARYALQYNLPILSFYIRRLKRGFYTMDTFELVADPQQFTQNEICEKIVREYERQVLLDPSNWLWTHKRWKHQKEDYFCNNEEIS